MKKINRHLSEIRAMLEDLAKKIQQPAVGIDVVHVSFGRNHFLTGMPLNKLPPNRKIRTPKNGKMNVGIDGCSESNDFTCEGVFGSENNAYEDDFKTEKNEQQLFDEMPEKGLCEENLQVFDEMPRIEPTSEISVPGLMGVASPCALVVAPLTYATASSACARKGIALKGGHVLDALASCQTTAFDKTSTLAIEEFVCKAIEPIPGHFSNKERQIASCCIPRCEKEALAVAAPMEKGTTRPIRQDITLGVHSGWLNLGAHHYPHRSHHNNNGNNSLYNNP